MKNATDDVDLFHTVFAELKHMGVKVPKVKKFKTVLPKQDRCTGKPKNKIFGVYLHEQEWVTGPEGLIPKFIAEATTYLLKYSKEVGLFRKAGSVARQRNLRAKLEGGQDLAGSDANDVASLLKQWLRELPEPLIPHCMQDLFIRCLHLGNEESRITASLLTSLLLPPDHLHTLKHLLCFLEKFAADSNENKMGAYNLALMMAPNIFVSGTEIADKNSNNLVPLHASAIQLLIENADKIGEIPTGVSFCASLQDWKSGSELDSSGDILDFSPKLKKRRKSGQLQDLLSGIKKLVGQNATPGTNLKMTPEKHCNARVGGPKSASKRKADPDQQISSSVAKQPILMINAKEGISLTPKTKDLNADCKSANRHSRRKSFGLLRRKERKRQKSSKPNCEVKMSMASTHSQNHNVHENGEPAVQASPASNEHHVETLSPLQCNFEDFLKSVNMKKATSDCYLTPTLRRLSKSPKPTSISQSRLYDKLQTTSPYWLRSEKTSEITNQQYAPKFEWLQHSSENKLTDLGTAELKGTEKATPSETFPTPRRSPRLKVDPSINISNWSQNNSQEQVTNAAHEKRRGSENPIGCSLLSDSIYGLNNPVRKRSNSTGTKLTRKAGITRQEGFILKSRNKTDFQENEKKNFQHKENIKDSHLHRKESVVSNYAHQGISVINLSRNGSRHGSIIRGRPNSVKTGLLSQSLKNKLISPSLDVNETDKLFKVEIDLNEENLSVHNSPLIEHNGQVQDEVKSPEKKDLSLIAKFDSFCISPNASITKIDTNYNTETKVPSDRKLRSSSNISEELTRKPKRKLSLPSSLDVVPAGAGRKMPKLRSSLEQVGSISIPKEEQKDSEIQEPCGLDASGCFKIPAPSKETTFNFSNLELSMNDSCFKTPTQNPSSSPNSITWVSGPKFLGFGSPEEEDNFNKRESIALILKNKSGHVQEKVNLYDNRIRDSIYCTRSVQSCSTPYIAFSINRNSSHRETTPSHRRIKDSQKSCKSLTKSESCNSNSRRNHVKGKLNSQKLPLPPPPKFTITDIDTPSPKTNCPLKEVTNICLGLDESTNSQNNTPGKDRAKRLTQSPLNVNAGDKNAGQKHRKLKRNSFSGHTPHTFQKRVSRSDSSPCPRKSKMQSGMAQG